MHCVKCFPNGQREQYKPGNYQVRDIEQARRDDRALAEGRLGIELLCGELSGVIALDIECDELNAEEEFNRYVPGTDCVKIGSKGETRFYLWKGEKSEQFYDASGSLVAEILSCNAPGTAPALCKLPPSLHPKTNNAYVFVDSVPLRRSTLKPLGNEALAYLRERFVSRGAGAKEHAQQQGYVNGVGRDDTEGYALHEYPHIVSALRAITPDIDYPRWHQIAMAVRYALGCTIGYQLFTQWSRGDLSEAPPHKFDYQTEGMIRAFFDPKRQHSSALITHATLYGLAKEFGSTAAQEAAKSEDELLVTSLEVEEGSKLLEKSDEGMVPTTSLKLGPVSSDVRAAPPVPPTVAPLPQDINYLDNPVQVAQRFFSQGSSVASVLFFADRWYAYSSVNNKWWELADTALIDRRIEHFIIENGYNWLNDKDSKVKVDVPLPDAELAAIDKEEAQKDAEIEAAAALGEKVERRGRKKKRTRTITQYDKYPCIDIKQSQIAEVRAAVTRLAARETSVTPNKWLDEVSNSMAPDCIAVHNGVVDIRKGELYHHSPHFFNLSNMPVIYRGKYQDGVCPRWLESLSMYFGGEQSCIDVLQLAFGYTLLSNMHLKKIFILQGERNSGKTTITNVLSAMLGTDNVLAGSNDSLTNAFGNAGLDKAKMLYLDEFSLRKLSSREVDALKRLSGGGVVQINQKHEKAYSANISARVWISTNDDVHRYEDTGRALSDRVVFWACQPISDEAKIPDFEQVLLQKEASGILSWTLQGCERLLAGERIVQPGGKSQLQKELFIDAGRSTFKEFVESFIVYDSQSTGVTTFSAMYQVYNTLMLDHGKENAPGKPGYLSLGRFARKIADTAEAHPNLKGTQLMTGTGNAAGLRFCKLYGVSLV
jgi:P4 family phage/plasmid primase-like protien